MGLKHPDTTAMTAATKTPEKTTINFFIFMSPKITFIRISGFFQPVTPVFCLLN
jgi:hypothetical protein